MIAPRLLEYLRAMLFAPIVLALLASTPQADAEPHDAKAPAAETATTEADCHHPASASAAQPPQWVLTRGAKISSQPSLPVAAVLTDATRHDGKTVVLEGVVRKACERKGCWMELAASKEDKNPGVRVTFKDYGFFVPLDSAGATARVEGQLKVGELTDGRAKHYESEGALVPRGEDGKPREVQLVATGVELRR